MAFLELGIGFVGVSLAFGLTVLTMAYVVGHISGGHFNLAVLVSLLVGVRFDKKTSCLTSPYKLLERSQLLLCYILSLKARLDLTLLRAVLLAMDTASTHQMATA